MRDRWVLRAGAVLLGGVISEYSRLSARVFILALLVLIFIRILRWKPADFARSYFRPEIIILTVSVVIGFIYGMTAERGLAEPLVIKNIEVRGELIDWSTDEIGGKGIFEIDDTRDRYYLKVYSEVISDSSWAKVRQGDSLAFTAKLEQPNFSGTEGGFDPQLYNAVRGIRGTLYTSGETEIIKEGRSSFVWLIREEVRKSLVGFENGCSAVFEGILFGDSSQIPDNIIERYKVTGVLHVFAASGANVAFVITLVWGLLFFLPRKARILVCVGLIFFYALLCGANPPIMRASILGTAVLLGMIGKGRVSSLRWLAFAGVILFAWNPLYLRDIGFQLSFSASWGIIVLAKKMGDIKIFDKMPILLRFTVLAVFGVQLASLPLLMACFHRVSLIGLLANVFVLFILGAVLQFGLIGTILLIYKPFALVFFQVSIWLIEFTDTVLGFLAKISLADFWVLNPGILFFVFWYVSLAVWLIGRKKVWFVFRVQLRKLSWTILIWHEKLLGKKLESGQKAKSYCGVFLTKEFAQCIINLLKKEQYQKTIGIVIVLILFWSPWNYYQRLEVVFVDIGQGDCILLHTAEENIMVDTGPKTESFDSGESIVVPYLMQRGIGSLDILFITHEDGDHIGGANYIVNNIPVNKIGVSAVGERLYNEEWQNGIPIQDYSLAGKLLQLSAGDRLDFTSGMVIEVLAPVEVLTGTNADSNNNSLVIKVRYMGKSILLTGDMELEEMQTMVERGANWDVDFLKIPHHGGKSSFDEEWFDNVNPEAVFICVGRNSFGHPTEKVLSYWNGRDIPLYRTDEDGTIQLIIDKNGTEIIRGRDK
ncbi:MAG: DNA internalization-related competence protein ComEC/Rec2 [Eubacteriales bacterium]